jgi:hypothetical protein
MPRLERGRRCRMSEETKDPQKDPRNIPLPPQLPLPLQMDPKWRGWYIEIRVACADIAAVMEDQLRPARERDLGVREAMRIYKDAREKLMSLFAYAERGGDPVGDTPR